MIKSILYRFILIILLPIGTYAQKTDSTVHNNSEDITLHEEGLIKIIQQQREDSIKRKELEDKLLHIQLNDRKEKEKLLSEINLLKSRDSILFERKKSKIDSLRTLNEGAPVAPFRDTILTIYNQLGSYSKFERAHAIENRIRTLADNYLFHPDSLQMEQNEDSWIIFWKDQMVISVNDQDAMWADTDKDKLAKYYYEVIQQNIVQYRDDHSLKAILMGIFFAILIITVVVLTIYLIRKGIKWIKGKILKSKDRYIKGIIIRGATIVSPQRQRKFIWLILNTLQWILFFTSIYLALPFILNQFPGTEGYASTLFNYFLSPLKNIAAAVIDYLPNLATIIVICLVFKYVLQALKFLAKEIEEGNMTIPGFYTDWARPTYAIIRTLFLLFMLIVIFPYFPGADSPIFKGVSVFVGVLITFSSAGVLGNIVSGLMLTYMRPFSIGDRIKIGEVSGDIIEKTLLATRVRTVKNEIISIPNSQVMNSHTINYSMDNEEFPLIIHTTLTVAYEIPWQRVHELALQACHQVELLESTPTPFVLQIGLADFYVVYQVNAYTKHPHKQATIYSELHKQILDTFHDAGIELLSPQYMAIRDGSQVDVPNEHKGKTTKIDPIKVDFRYPPDQTK